MIVSVEHFLATTRCHDEAELRAVLALRNDDGMNELWICGAEPHPCIAFLVRDERAVLHFFPRAGHPGFVSRGSGDPDAVVVFSTHGDAVSLTGDAIIAVATAVDAAVEFARTCELPSTIRWFEL